MPTQRAHISIVPRASVGTDSKLRCCLSIALAVQGLTKLRTSLQIRTRSRYRLHDRRRIFHAIIAARVCAKSIAVAAGNQRFTLAICTANVTCGNCRRCLDRKSKASKCASTATTAGNLRLEASACWHAYLIESAARKPTGNQCTSILASAV